MKARIRTLLKLLGGMAFLVIVLWLGGMFAQSGIAPEVLAAPVGKDAPTHTGTAARVQHALQYRAVGSIESRTRVEVTARISGQLLQVEAQVGDAIERGDLLAVIDSRDITSRVEQARSGLAAAMAQETRATAAAQRARNLLAAEAATAAQVEGADAAAAAATAGVAAARERIREAQIGLDFSRITAPMAGIVASRPIERGDMAWPGLPLYTLLDPANLRIEAWVREGEIEHVTVGAEYALEVPSRELRLLATVDEIVPSADPQSRSFLVRASFPTSAGLHPGMFARLVIETGVREVVEIESAAVRRIGQLHTTLVKSESGWIRRYITLGHGSGETVEVLSGLSGGETIGWRD